MMDSFYPAQSSSSNIIQSTAGAIPIRNDKGELSMQKVKVSRYVTGKRPEYAPQSSDEESSDEEFQFLSTRKQASAAPTKEPEDVQENEEEEEDANLDPRLRRLKEAKEKEVSDEEEDNRLARRRRIHEPEVLEKSDSEGESEPEQELESYIDRPHVKRMPAVVAPIESEESSEEEEELDDEEIERRRQVLRQRALNRTKETETEVMEVEEEKDEEAESEEEESDSEYEEYSDSEDEVGPRLKPVFVRKKDRITIQEKEKEVQKQKDLEAEARRMVEERRKASLRMVEEEIKKERSVGNPETVEAQLGDINTDDENDEAEYEAWKVRELKRIKRDREERELKEKDRLEIERIHGMTEEERRMELSKNPKQITNKATKGKYKFLQKYYHRGVFFLDEDKDLYKRDFSSATLEDHFDKTILPKVMQVKNFGRSGRTKYTHLIDQDTTAFDSPWSQESAMNMKFNNSVAGGVKPVFEKPTLSKKRKKQQTQ